MDKDRFNSMFLDGIQVRCKSGSSCNVHAGADSVEKASHRDYNDTTISLAMATVTRVAGDKECDGGKSDGDDEKGCGRATATAPKREVAAATRAAGDEEGDGKGDESDGDAYEESDGGGN
jgi:hypothetical protein